MENIAPTTTERDREDAYRAEHDECMECGEEVCKEGVDGLPVNEFCSCNADTGEPVEDASGVVGYIHAHCRESLIVKQLRDDIEQALTIREIPLLIAKERANNLCMQVFNRCVEMGMTMGGKIRVL